MGTQTEANFNRLIASAFEHKVSDLYLFPGQAPFVRKDGEITVLSGEQVITSSFIEEILTSLLSSNQQEELKKQQQVIFSGALGKGQRAKISVFKQKGLSTVSIKLVPEKIISLESLKLPSAVTDLASLDRGLIIISGPRDSGRTSLLAAMIDYINRNFVEYIATLEWPIEYLYMGGKSLVEQREIGRDALTFKDGLMSIKNRNVDVLIVSGIESPTIFFELLEIAQKGVLVFALMDASSAFNVIKQLVEFFEGEKRNLVQLLLGENLGGVICTRLVPKLGGGRILALEILNGSPAARASIKEGKFHQIHNLLQVTEKELSISLDRFLADLVRNSVVTIDEALKYCIDEDNLQSLVRK